MLYIKSTNLKLRKKYNFVEECNSRSVLGDVDQKIDHSRKATPFPDSFTKVNG
jgi:hypothetical protein